ncbi:MAG: hypothetical protein ACXVCK_22005, partial [Bdellovibrionota bacterium]
KVKFHDFKGTTHETSARHWPTEADFEKLLRNAWERRKRPVRLLGIGVRLEGESVAGEPVPEEEKRPWQLSFRL